MTKIAFLLYDDMTALDFVGPHEVLARLPSADVLLVSPHGGTVRTDLGMLIAGTVPVDDAPVPDVVIVPGGPNTMNTNWGPHAFDWLRAVAAAGGWTCSVCTGALALGAAGLLKGRRATTHWAMTSVLPSMGAVAVDDRVCFDGRVVTAAGVSAGIDMGLALAAVLADDATAEALQLGLEYDPQPPFDSGSLAKASEATVDTALRLLTGTMS